MIKFAQLYAFYSILYSVFRECDATIVTTSYAYEPASLDAMKQWFYDMQKEVHVLGPLLPYGYGIQTQNSEEGSSVDIESFLTEMQAQHGKRSVFFVRFFFSDLKSTQINNFSHHNQINFFSGFLRHYFLSHSFGIPRWIDWSPYWKESTICKWRLFCIHYFMIQAYSNRFTLMHPPSPKFRSNW